MVLAVFDKENNKIYIDDKDYVVVTRMNHILELQYSEKRNNAATIKKIDKNKFVVLSTGEVKEFKLNENRSQNANSMRKTFKKLRYLINNNFVGNANELFITLTYRENMLDTVKLYEDFKKFIQRLKYKYSDMGKIEYIDVVEPQKRGAWHHHVLIKFVDQISVFVPNKELADVWSHGFVRVNRINDIDNVGAYLTAYLADIPLDEMDSNINVIGEVVEKKIGDKTKKIVKGGRLYMYPSGINLYRKSKGIKYPDRKVMKYKNAKKMVGNSIKTVESNTFLEIDDYTNHIKFEQYNLKRGR